MLFGVAPANHRHPASSFVQRPHPIQQLLLEAARLRRRCANTTANLDATTNGAPKLRGWPNQSTRENTKFDARRFRQQRKLLLLVSGDSERAGPFRRD